MDNGKILEYNVLAELQHTKGKMRVKTRIDRFKVKQRMEALGIATFEELAKMARISTATMYNSLDGYNYRSQTLDAIANALGCSSRDITTIDE